MRQLWQLHVRSSLQHSGIWTLPVLTPVSLEWRCQGQTRHFPPWEVGTPGHVQERHFSPKGVERQPVRSPTFLVRLKNTVERPFGSG